MWLVLCLCSQKDLDLLPGRPRANDYVTTTKTPGMPGERRSPVYQSRKNHHGGKGERDVVAENDDISTAMTRDASYHHQQLVGSTTQQVGVVTEEEEELQGITAGIGRWGLAVQWLMVEAK